MSHKNREDAIAYQRGYDARRTTEQREANAAARRRRERERSTMMDDLKAKPCMDCGRSFPPECMDFDHRPGEVKVSNVVWMKVWGLQRLLAEIAKCDLVCSNCHRTRTRNRGQA